MYILYIYIHPSDIFFRFYGGLNETPRWPERPREKLSEDLLCVFFAVIHIKHCARVRFLCRKNGGEVVFFFLLQNLCVCMYILICRVKRLKTRACTRSLHENKFSVRGYTLFFKLNNIMKEKNSFYIEIILLYHQQLHSV